MSGRKAYGTSHSAPIHASTHRSSSASRPAHLTPRRTVAYSHLAIRQECRGAQDRIVAGHARRAHPEDPRPRPQPRMGHFQPDAPAHPRRTPHEPGLTVSSAAPSRDRRPRPIRDEDDGEQSTRAGLHADAGGTAPSSDRNRELGAVRRVDAARAQSDVTGTRQSDDDLRGPAAGFRYEGFETSAPEKS